MPNTKSSYKIILDGLTIKAFGVVHWDIANDQGCLHYIANHNSALVLPALLSQQHWNLEANDHFLMPQGTIMDQYSHECKLYWGQKKLSKQFPWIQNTTLHIFIWHPVLPNFGFLTNDFKKVHLCNCHLGLRGGRQ